MRKPLLMALMSILLFSCAKEEILVKEEIESSTRAESYRPWLYGPTKVYRNSIHKYEIVDGPDWAPVEWSCPDGSIHEQTRQYARIKFPKDINKVKLKIKITHDVYYGAELDIEVHDLIISGPDEICGSDVQSYSINKLHDNATVKWSLIGGGGIIIVSGQDTDRVTLKRNGLYGYADLKVEYTFPYSGVKHSEIKRVKLCNKSTLDDIVMNVTMGKDDCYIELENYPVGATTQWEDTGGAFSRVTHMNDNIYFVLVDQKGRTTVTATVTHNGRKKVFSKFLIPLPVGGGGINPGPSPGGERPTPEPMP